MKNTLGLFIGRLNPPHKGHIGIIEKALKENSEVLLLLGDNGIIDSNNPLSFEQRKKILLSYFWNTENLKIEIIEDTKTDKEWVENIYDRINIFSVNKQINFYYGDFQNDSALNAITGYKKYLLDIELNYILTDRSISKVNFNGEEFLVSSTLLREALVNKDYNLASKFCNEEIFKDIKEYF